MPQVRFAVIGDSFSEGVGDELPDGTVRGWPDIVAQGWANGIGAPIEYANFAVRGKLAWQIVEEQLEQALALGPTHLSFNGGGNDMLRPRVDIEHIADAFARVLRRCDDEGVRLILLSGANPSPHLPLGSLTQRRGDQMADAVARRIRDRPDVIRALNWPDRVLSRLPFWSEDRLHMNAFGHHRVAARVLFALGVEAPAQWWATPAATNAKARGAGYYREHLGPWIGRRLRGTSSGDGRLPKHPTWVAKVPE